MTSYVFKTNLGCESREEVGSFEEKQQEAKYLVQVYLSSYLIRHMSSKEDEQFHFVYWLRCAISFFIFTEGA
jgi:hypothetical protein